jgi:hypothetical protein
MLFITILPPEATTTTDTRLAEFGKIDQYNSGLSTDEQLSYQHKGTNERCILDVFNR